MAGKLGLSLALIHASASAVWPPTGIALASLLVLGRWAWPAILAGAFLVNITAEGNLATSLGIASGNTLEAVAGTWLVARFADGTGAFYRPRDTLRFLVLAGGLATAVSPSFGVTSLCLAGYADWSEYGRIWLTWWLGDAGGAVVVAPPLILWAQTPRPGWTSAQWLEASASLVLIVVVGVVAFACIEPLPGGPGSLSFLCLPVTIWTAFRFGTRETASAVLLFSAIAVWGTISGANSLRGEAANEALLHLQLFLAVIASTSLLLAGVVAERRHALETLERQAAALKSANAELDDFAHVVSHDLKAPLRGISSLAAWIAEDCDALLPPDSREHLAQLGERAQRMRRLIDGVLRYSRVGRGENLPTWNDSRAIVEEVIDSLGPTGGVEVRIAAPLPLILCDRTQLTQIFQNLIQNAVQHMGSPRGSVVVSCRERTQDFEFCVSDDGVGISEIHRERIFRIFQTLDPEGGTTGVGLAIVKKAVERHGGRVGVESTAGRGASFRFTIPKGRIERGPRRSL